MKNTKLSQRYKIVKPKTMMGNFIVDTETNKIVETVADTTLTLSRINHWNRL